MTRRWLCGLMGLALAYAGAALAQSEDQITLRAVKYDGLKETILKQRGKVVLVDFWGEY